MLNLVEILKSSYNLVRDVYSLSTDSCRLAFRYDAEEKREGQMSRRTANGGGGMDSSQKMLIRSTFRSDPKPMYTCIVEFVFVLHSKVYCSRLR